MDDNQLKYNNLKAEFYLSAFYADIQNPIAVKKGQFYQDYCNDCINVDTDNNTVELSRDGVFRQLPENIFFNEQYLSIHDKQLSIKNRSLIQQEHRKVFENFFIPFDTFFFHKELRIEQKISLAEINAKRNLLRSLYDFDVDTERNPLIIRLAFFRIDSSTIKGDLRLLAYIVKSILQEDTQIATEYRTMDEILRIKQPVIVVTVLIDQLSAVQYRKKIEQYEDFFEKLAEWFFPFECDYEYSIKDKHQPFVLGDNLILDYNTQLL